ncbi:glycosyltransferase family 4 protein [Pedobacter kyonggii]|uniref:Glycosyltransferase family 1 protein n=1 Tax=Pedobacter kyonggii TaxID=1926871 RepID=A0A4Q9HGR5_9SPHI|nr:glycosyltransferase family 4 protein [Pedobacter kyonggii]TBO44305.1 glycosyltransferase family 1 protein [Pedobacter kyonggii]
MNKKLLVINNSSKISGAEISLLTLLDSLKYDFSFIVIVPDKGGDLYAKLISLGYKVKCINMMRFSKNYGFYLKLTYLINVIKCSFLIRSYALTNKIDLVYANSNQSMMFVLFVRFCSRIKVVWHVRDRNENRYLTWAMSWIAHKIICISKYICDQIPIGPSKKILIYNGLNPDIWKPVIAEKWLLAKLNLDADTLLVGQVGQLVPWKNHKGLIDVIEQTVMYYKKVHFLFIGEDLFYENDSCIRRLKETIKSKKLESSITFLGYQSEVMSYMNQLDIVIHCAQNEPFGRVIIEGMSIAKPVVAYMSGGIKEIITHNYTGFLAPFNDHSRLSDYLLTLLNDSKLRKKFGANARKEVINRFSTAEMSTAVKNNIYSLLK